MSEQLALPQYVESVLGNHRAVESVLGRGIMVCAAGCGQVFTGTGACDARRLALAIDALYERAPKTMARIVYAVEHPE